MVLSPWPDVHRYRVRAENSETQNVIHVIVFLSLVCIIIGKKECEVETDRKSVV